MRRENVYLYIVLSLIPMYLVFIGFITLIIRFFGVYNFLLGLYLIFGALYYSIIMKKIMA